MARDLFCNVKDLYEQIDTQYTDRSREECMGAQMAVSDSSIALCRPLLTFSRRRFASTLAASSRAICSNSPVVSVLGNFGLQLG